ncbi:protein FAR1-RELATED SEQUENCE 5-like [Lactuca sativa]|uniref:protein FAR1-RELATED SEQUENCE 5-like n=1 Tax=Lactuca sativa TaxID=4236 RepID=UPI001C68C38E|nr:protein FAR1-RELATED SEQUENCE 5-like [Lactuca sativa]
MAARWVSSPEDEINDVQTASVDDDFLSSDDEFCSTDDNPAFGKVDIIDDHNERDFTVLENIDQSIQLPDATDIELCKERKYDCLDQHLVIAGKSYWIPAVPDDVKPIINHKYPSDDAIEDMYRRFACATGFDVRKSTNKKKRGIVYIKYLLCNREEKHNHPLISRDNMLFARHHRQLDDTKKSFILAMSNQNIGATIAHRLYTSILGGYNFVGGLIDDFKNYMRDLNCFIGGSDAQMLVDKLNNKKENVKNFSFEYRVENKQLNVIFWADETSKINYKEFGDVVSFDATFRTNRYHMVFVPFTGIDNHKRCVTFGVGLLSREDTDSYIWLLKSFLKAFGKQPLLVLSDQDSTMKKAIEAVFPQSIHWLCMWYITSKLPLKLFILVYVSLNIINNPEFRKKFNFLIWNLRLEVDDFEVGWKSLLNEYKLTDNKWLDDMHGLRHFWIPASFKHVPLSGLMRTTSSSETAMEKQRFT